MYLALVSRECLSQGMRKAEGTSEKMDHLVKTRNQAIQRLQQEIAVSTI